MAKQAGSGRILWCTPFILSALTSISGPAMAATNTLSGGLDNRYSDNAGKDSANANSDLESRVNLSYQHQSDPGRCESSADIKLGYGYWHQETFDDELYTNGRARGECELIKGLVWHVSESISQVSQNSREPNTPDNRTRKDVFTTGPAYTLELTPLDQLRFSATYENTEYEEPEEPDGEKVIGSVGYNRILTGTWSGGVSATAERTELDTQEELDRDSVTLNTQKSWTTTDLSASLGYNQLETRLGSLTLESDGITGSLALSRQLSTTSDLSLYISRQLTDQTSTLGLQFDDFSFDLQDSAGVEVTAVNVAYNNELGGGSTLGVDVRGTQSDYLTTDSREQAGTLSVGFSRPLTALVSLSGDATYQYVKYDSDGSDDQNTSVSVGLNYLLSQKLELRTSIGHEEKESDVAAREYSENWIAASLNYRFF